MEIELTNVTRSDDYLKPGKFDETILFMPKLRNTIPLSKVFPFWRFMLQISLDPSIRIIRRNVYSYPDLLADVGGLYSSVFLIAWSLAYFINFKDLHFFMVSKIYRKD